MSTLKRVKLSKEQVAALHLREGDYYAREGTKFIMIRNRHGDEVRRCSKEDFPKG